MGEGLSPGQWAMAACWGACAVGAYVVAAGLPAAPVHRGVVIGIMMAVALGAFSFADGRGMRIGDGIGWALAIGGLIGVARRGVQRRPAP